MDERDRRIVVVMGASGAGKTTVGTALARALGWAFLDADDLHPPENVARMARGLPLTEADREPWLERLAARMRAQLARGEPLVVACSALRARHRARIDVAPGAVLFAFLEADAELLRERLAARRGHFFDPALLASQLATLEPPADALRLDAALDVQTLVRRIRAALGDER